MELIEKLEVFYEFGRPVRTGIFRCQCGNEVIRKLSNGKTVRSCGCLKNKGKEALRKQIDKLYKGLKHDREKIAESMSIPDFNHDLNAYSKLQRGPQKDLMRKLLTKG